MARYGPTRFGATNRARALKSADLRRRLDEIGYEAIGSTPQEYIAHIDASIEKWRRVVTAGNIKPE